MRVSSVIASLLHLAIPSRNDHVDSQSISHSSPPLSHLRSPFRSTLRGDYYSFLLSDHVAVKLGLIVGNPRILEAPAKLRSDVSMKSIGPPSDIQVIRVIRAKMLNARDVFLPTWQVSWLLRRCSDVSSDDHSDRLGSRERLHARV